METAKQEADKPFPQEQELKEKSVRLAELDILLNMDKSQPEAIDSEPEQVDEERQYGRVR